MRLEIDGQKLREARTSAHISRNLLSEDTAWADPMRRGISPGMIDQWENGRRTGITLDKLEWLTQALNKSIEGGGLIREWDLLLASERESIEKLMPR